MNAERVLEEYKEQIKYEMKKIKSPVFVSFVIKNYGKKAFENKDLIETKGFYNGLKAALQILESVIESDEYETEMWEE